jgi:hypothetical protein
MDMGYARIWLARFCRWDLRLRGYNYCIFTTISPPESQRFNLFTVPSYEWPRNFNAPHPYPLNETGIFLRRREALFGKSELCKQPLLVITTRTTPCATTPVAQLPSLILGHINWSSPSIDLDIRPYLPVLLINAEIQFRYRRSSASEGV